MSKTTKKQVKSNKKDVLTVDTVKCSKKDTIVVHKNAPKSAIKLSGKRYEDSFKRFQRDGLSPEERLLNLIFPENKRKGIPKEMRTREEHARGYVFTESYMKEHDAIERKFNNGRKLVILSDKDKKRIDVMRKRGLSVKAIAKEMHRSDHTVREYLNGSLNMSVNDMEKHVKSGKRPAHLARVNTTKKR